MSDERQVVEFVHTAVAATMKRPAAVAADAYYKESRHRRWLVSSGDTVRSAARETGFAVRIFRIDGRVGHGSASGQGDDENLTTVLEAADAAAQRCSPLTATLPPGSWTPPDLDLFDPTLEQVPAVEGLLLRMESAVEQEGRGEVEVQSLLAIAGGSRISMATSAGFAGSYASSLLTVLLALRARRGGETVFHRSLVAARHLAELDAHRVARRAVRAARLPLDGGVAPAGRVRVALEPQVACLILGHLAPSLHHDAAERGRSSLPAVDPGGPVASGAVSVVDDPTLPRGMASLPFDGEGRPTARRVLIDAGRPQELLGSSEAGDGPVGAMHRMGFADPPRRTPSNLHLARGERSPANILANAGSVLRVTGATLLGRGGPASGEIALSATAERLENGEPAGGLRQVTLVGKVPELLAGVQEVGNDLSFHLRGGVLGAPTVLLDGMRVP
jgi:PmbA protein